MKTLLKYALLACIVAPFALSDRAMGGEWLGDNCYWSDIERGGWKAVYYKDKGKWIWEDHTPRVVGPGRNQRVQPKPSDRLLPTTPPPHIPDDPKPSVSPQPPTSRGAFIEKIDNANGFSSNSPLNGNVVNGNVLRQTTVVRGIPGTVRLPFAISQGLRLGIGATNHPGGGVCVTDVLPDSPGDLADFEVGDVILEINGTPIHNLQDYSKAVDDSPERMDATVVNLNDGRINRTVELRR